MNEKELRYMKYIAEAGSVQKAAVLFRKILVLKPGRAPGGGRYGHHSL